MLFGIICFCEALCSANTPWDRVKFTLDFGTRAANLAMNSSGPNDRDSREYAVSYVDVNEERNVGRFNASRVRGISASIHIK